MNNGKLHIVLLEWGGEKPPSTWYRRLEAMAGIKVREQAAEDTGDLGLLMGRSGPREIGVVVQEGAIVCASYTLARTIHAMAQQGIDVVKADGTVLTVRPQAAYLGEVEIDECGVSENDRLALARMQAIYGKRGKRGPELEFAVTCMEEMVTHNVATHAVANCPRCGGVQIHARPGHATRVADPVGDDVLTAWIRLRFGQSGAWEKPEVDPAGAEPTSALAAIGMIAELDERLFVLNLDGSLLQKQIDTVAGADREFAMRLYDAAFIGRLYWSAERRLNARLAAVTRYFQLGSTDVAGISLAELPQPDLFDVAPLLGADTAATLMSTCVARAKAASAPTAVPVAPVGALPSRKRAVAA